MTEGIRMFICLMLASLVLSVPVQASDLSTSWHIQSSASVANLKAFDSESLQSLSWSSGTDITPNGYVSSRMIYQGEPLTLSASVLMQDRLSNFDCLLLAGFLSEDSTVILGLRWLRETRGKRDSWRLQLITEGGLFPDQLVTGREGQVDIVELDLPVGHPQQRELYQAKLSYNPVTGQLFVKLQDSLTGFLPLDYQVNLDISTYRDGLFPVTGWEGNNPQQLVRENIYQIQRFAVERDFVHEGLPLALAEGLTFYLVDGNQERIYGSTIDASKDLAVYLQWPKNYLSGELSLTLVHQGKRSELMRSKWSEQGQLVPLADLPFGDSLLVLEYTRKETNLVTQKDLFIVGTRVSALFELYGRNYRRSDKRMHLPFPTDPGIYGTVTLHSEAPLTDELMTLRAKFTDSQGDIATISVLERRITTDNNGFSQIPFEFSIPQTCGEITLEPSFEQQGISVSTNSASTPVWAAPIVPAFPGAEGFGAFNPGGRGGQVYVVTNLADRGPGSLREAVEASGARIVVFSVSGVIELDSPLIISNPYITIAGQTAPGGGITLSHFPTKIDAHDVILRHLRFRLGDKSRQEEDSLEIRGNNVIVDHVTASWSIDESLSVTGADNVTVQWSMISTSLNRSHHSKGAHGYGSLIRGERGAKYSFHHNLWAHHRGRMPRPGNYTNYQLDPVGLLTDFRNNVFYNWGNSYSGANHDRDSITRYNFINNYYKMGPNSRGNSAFREDNPYAQAHFAGNLMNGEVPHDPWSLISGHGAKAEGYKQNKPFAAAPVITESAQDAYEHVLAGSGAQPRDGCDEQVILDVINRTGGIINSQSEVGGWPEVVSFPVPTDTDGDGIPDWWEVRHDLDPTDPLDAREDSFSRGYTNIEEFINDVDGIREFYAINHQE